MADGTKAPKGALIAGLVLMLLAFGGCGYRRSSFVGFAGELTDIVDGTSSTPWARRPPSPPPAKRR